MRLTDRPVPPRLALPLLLLAAAVGASACSRHRATAGPVGGTERTVRTDSVIVRVANRADHPLAIALARDFVQTPLGDVAPGAEARFALRTADVTGGRVELVASANRETMRTAPFRVHGGQVVWFDIVPGVVGSRLYIRYPEDGPPRQMGDR